MTKTSIDVGRDDILFEFIFSNYKQFTDYHSTVPNANVIIVEGKNKQGKTGLITALQESYIGKSMTDEPLQKGKAEGYKEIKVVDKNGNPVVVKHEFDNKNQKGKFVAYKEDGTPIRSIKDFKELLGEYLPQTVRELFNQAKTADGRKKLINDYIYKILPQATIERINFIDANIDPKNGIKFQERTTKNTQMQTYKTIVDAGTLTKDEKEKIAKKKTAEDLLEGYKQQKLDIENADIKIRAFNKWSGKLSAFWKEMSDDLLFISEDEKNTLANKFNDVDNIIAAQKNNVSSLKPEDKAKKLAELITSITKGETFIDDIKTLERKQENFNTSNESYEKIKKEWENLNTEIEDLREEKQRLIAESELPAGLSLNGDSFTLDGFDFSETQVSFSQASIVYLKLISQVSDCKMIVLGDAAEFDSNSMKEIVEYAHANDKYVVMSRVVDDAEDVKVIGITNPNAPTTKPKKKAELLEKPKEDEPQSDNKKGNLF